MSFPLVPEGQFLPRLKVGNRHVLAWFILCAWAQEAFLHKHFRMGA